MDIRRHKKARRAHPAERMAIRVKRDVEDFDVLAAGCVVLTSFGQGAKGFAESASQHDMATSLTTHQFSTAEERSRWKERE